MVKKPIEMTSLKTDLREEGYHSVGYNRIYLLQKSRRKTDLSTRRKRFERERAIVEVGVPRLYHVPWISPENYQYGEEHIIEWRLTYHHLSQN
jgi:hypothetical protein